MINSMSVAMEYCSLLPKGAVPELTEGYEGFIHLDTIQGDVEHTKMQFLIRDHDKALFQQKKDLMEQAAAYLNVKYPSQPVKVTIKRHLLQHEGARSSPLRGHRGHGEGHAPNGVEPITLPIRGGTERGPALLHGSALPQQSAPAGPTPTASWSTPSWRDMEAIKEIIKTAAYLVE